MAPFSGNAVQMFYQGTESDGNIIVGFEVVVGEGIPPQNIITDVTEINATRELCEWTCQIK